MGTGAIAAAALGMGALAGCSSVSGLETEARVLAQPACSDFFFPIYFKERRSEVPAAARRVIAASGQRSRGCRIAEVKVVGLPDPKAPPEAKLVLAHDRSTRVVEALKAAGFPEPVFQLSALGDAAANAPGATLPRRRADVYVRFSR
jgi:outer membrane protein OmpA-like peptidoglycan-associated protein